MNGLNSSSIRQADRYIDERHETFTTLGRKFFGQFDSDKGRLSTQVRNLQQIACAATRFADIEDFVKNQMGKGDKNWKALGNEILQQLGQLRKDSQELGADPDQQMAMRLRLARGWVRAVVSEYLYQVALKQMGNRA